MAGKTIVGNGTMKALSPMAASNAAANLVRWLVNSIADRGRAFLNDPARSSLNRLCQDLVSERGEASGTAIAREIATRYRDLNTAERTQFFDSLLEREWLADPDEVLRLARAYHAHPGPDELAKLFPVAEPRRQELFRRINMGPRGTETLVQMRADLLALLRKHPRFSPIDMDLVHLLSSWFNRGFLELRRIDWRTSALILEKLISHEAVHEIRGWPDLRRRLEQDRRCFAFFHPALPDEPLIFVEVALRHGMAESIEPLIDVASKPEDLTLADTAVFYSINNCLDGLRSISFGAFLIKQVVYELQKDVPALKHFVTLSPIPRFREWLLSRPAGEVDAIPGLSGIARATLRKSTAGNAANDAAKTALLRACARYLTSHRADRRALDPVAAFHLSNGASIERINWMGDPSEKGIKQSYGLMVNYAYRPARIERNHEHYAKNGKFAMSDEVRELLETPAGKNGKPRKDDEGQP